MVATASHIHQVYQKKVETWLNILSNSETWSFCGRMKKIFWVLYQYSIDKARWTMEKVFPSKVSSVKLKSFRSHMQFYFTIQPASFMSTSRKFNQSHFRLLVTFEPAPAAVPLYAAFIQMRTSKHNEKFTEQKKSYQRWSIEIRFHLKSHFNLHKFWLRREKSSSRARAKFSIFVMDRI